MSRPISTAFDIEATPHDHRICLMLRATEQMSTALKEQAMHLNRIAEALAYLAWVRS